MLMQFRSVYFAPSFGEGTPTSVAAPRARPSPGSCRQREYCPLVLTPGLRNAARKEPEPQRGNGPRSLICQLKKRRCQRSTALSCAHGFDCLTLFIPAAIKPVKGIKKALALAALLP